MGSQAINYDALAQQHGATVDYDALAAQHGATPAEQPEGFWHSLGSQLGLTPEAAKQRAREWKDHPITKLLDPAGFTGLVKGVYDQASQSLGDIGSAFHNASTGNIPQSQVDMIHAVPILGPAELKAADQYGTGNKAGMMGTIVGAAGQAAPVALAAADAAGVPRPNTTLANAMDKFPTRAKAGAIFNDLNTKLAEQPVPLQNTAAPLQRATEIAARGGSLPKPVSDLLTRSQAIEPMTFPEARDYQSALSDLSTADKMAMNGRMRGAVAQLSQALYQDLRTAAESGAGMGADYDTAMAKYRQAAQMNNAAKKVGSMAAKGAATGLVGGAAAAGGYNLLKLLQESK